MKVIEYRVTLSDGSEHLVEVQARDTQAGLSKAVSQARNRWYEIHSIAFSQVKS